LSAAPSNCAWSSACKVRDAVAADLPAIQRIYAHYVRQGTATFEESAPDAPELTRRWREVVDAGFPWLVAEEAGAVVGYAYANHYRLRSAYRFTCEDSVYLDPAACHRGLGTALLQAVIARCETRGWRQMIAVIGDSGNQGSVRLHARLGFTPTGTLCDVGFKLGRWLDVVLMQRRLGEGGLTSPRERNP